LAKLGPSAARRRFTPAAASHNGQSSGAGEIVSEFRTWSRYVIGAVSTVYLIQGVVLL